MKIDYIRFRKRFLIKFLHEDLMGNPIIYSKSDIQRHMNITEKEMEKRKKVNGHK